ncbi:hypothetical protein M5K25_025074 [Dendrobium thyrsiflorum]|uniref:Uncharacterized protein n=1 Tax=Dendrobium thyrsiflorum TaxID=117978 RepID=A0ABD0U3J8_DENTH
MSNIDTPIHDFSGTCFDRKFPFPFSFAKQNSDFLTTPSPQTFHDEASCSIPILHHVADPEQDHGFVYNEQGHVNILNSPFFDVNPEVDQTIEEYVERITFTLATAVEDQLSSVQWLIRIRQPNDLVRSPSESPVEEEEGRNWESR